MENEVQQALAVMDKETGKLINYCQIMRHPKYRKAWSILAANKFGQLTQGVGGRINGINTIHCIHRHKVPPKRLNDVTYRQFV